MALFVAAIERVGARYVPQGGARRRFRHALELVRSDDEVESLMEFYGLRSGAAHGDLITGQPLTTDQMPKVGWFYSSDEAVLQSKVWTVRQVSRQILELALVGVLPGPEQG